MGITRGPQYPGIEDGLIFSFDPKNRKCWNGGVVSGTDYTGIITDLVGSLIGTCTNMEGDEFDDAITTKGYFDFDGSDDTIPIASAPASFQMQTFSIEAWVAPGAGLSIGICELDPSGWFLGKQSSQWSFYVLKSTGGWSIASHNVVPNTGQWYHLVGTISEGGSNNQKLYLNGVEAALSPVTSPTIAYSGNNFYLGRYAGSEWEGGLGPVNLYNRSLSAGEVLTNYNRLKGRFGL